MVAFRRPGSFVDHWKSSRFYSLPTCEWKNERHSLTCLRNVSHSGCGVESALEVHSRCRELEMGGERGF